MKKLLLSVAFASALAVPLACDLEKTSNQLQANKVMVATILSTPSFDIQPAALAGIDANFFPEWDGGTFFPTDSGFDGGGFDAGNGFRFDGGALTIPGQTATFIFFGARKSQSLDSPPDGISGAQVSVQPSGGAVTNLKEEGAGNYQKTSADDSAFSYVPGADYLFNVTSAGEKFVGKVEKAPALERISEFHPAKGYIEHTAGSSFTFVRPEPPAEETRNLGFIFVYPIKEDGQKGEQTYTNIPKTPLDFLELIAAPSEWRGSPVTIPGTAFPQSKRTYIIVFQSVKTGGPESDNLFTGSALLAGTAEIGIVKTQ